MGPDLSIWVQIGPIWSQWVLDGPVWSCSNWSKYSFIVSNWTGLFKIGLNGSLLSLWKIGGTTFQCIIVLQLRGEGPK